MSVSYSPLRNHNNAVEMTNGSVNNKLKHTAETSTTPLLLNPSAPIANFEADDDIDNGEDVTKEPNKNKGNNPDVESVDHKHSGKPTSDIEINIITPKDSESIEPKNLDEIPVTTNRLDPDGGTNPDEVDSKSDDLNRSPTPHTHRIHNLLGPGYSHDFELGSIPGEHPESIPDVNIYQHKKTLAQGMMDLALFSANANQLRYVLESYNRHPYFYPSVIFISISLLLQIAVGVGLIWNATYNVRDKREICIANKINNFTVIGIFLVTIINVFISAFGVAEPA